MKPLLNFVACLVLLWLISIASCNKEKANYKPVANAGADQVFNLSGCDAKLNSAELDGTGSSDPNNNIVRYLWRVVSATGTQTGTFTNLSSAKASLTGASTGDYVMELTVTDADGLSSKDTMLISIKAISKEFDFDITCTSTFEYLENAAGYDSWYYYYYVYYDLTTISGTGNFQPLGDFNIHISEYADTVDVSDVHNTPININYGFNNANYLYGDCSVNFKKLIKGGGGPINGTIRITGGSALACNPDVFTNLPPLTMTGTLDTTSKIVNLRIQGKVFF